MALKRAEALVEWGGGREQKMLENGDRGGHDPKTDRSSVVEWGGGIEQKSLQEGDRGGHGP